MKKLLSVVGTLFLSFFLLSCSEKDGNNTVSGSQEEEKNESQGNDSFLGALTADGIYMRKSRMKKEIEKSENPRRFQYLEYL